PPPAAPASRVACEWSARGRHRGQSRRGGERSEPHRAGARPRGWRPEGPARRPNATARGTGLRSRAPGLARLHCFARAVSVADRARSRTVNLPAATHGPRAPGSTRKGTSLLPAPGTGTTAFPEITNG